MKTFLILLVSTMALWAAGPAGGTGPLAIPAGAVAIESNLYRHTDAQGKTWIYRRTPFGITRAEARSVAPARAVELANAKAWDDGDAVRFEQPGPFGVYHWRTKKSSLDAAEQAVWARHQAGPAGGRD
ncbi:MAG: hypothetical protein ABSB23_05885 [Bryobacteraceae bacterium]|jgi:hypothetical protein